MASNNYWASGQWNFICELCGAKGKSKDGVKTWDGHYVCRSHKEMRNPQDFVRGVRENLTVPWARPPTTDQFVVTQCTLQGRTSVPGFAVPGCTIPGPVQNPAFMQATASSSCTREGILAIPGFAMPGCSTPSVSK
jgi:hypothetical protein